ncbi:Rv3235 family protein [Streptomyces sp. NPDC007088]|uniref:Rv3235 family protein n=1 Tax=Streptomyces sp. NPDC007088 TaxID=3364773 RepID=UPI00368AF2E5
MNRHRPATTRRPPTRTDARAPGARPRPRAPRPRPTPHELFAERLLSVLCGLRPVHHLIGHAVGEAYERAVTLAPVAAYRTAHPVLRGCRGVPLRRGVVEACASVEIGPRVHALAFRLEQGEDHRWRCTALELAAAHGPHRP